LSAIEVIRREKRKNKKLQVELDKKEDTQELEEMITNLKVQIEEDKIIEEANATSKENMEEWESLILVWTKEYLLVTQVQEKHTSVTT
jgi:hypothetical protein